ETFTPGEGEAGENSDSSPVDDPLAGTTAVNGGAKAEDGNGFNLDPNGNVVAIGRNVMVWGTSSTRGRDGQGTTPIDDFSSDKPILVYKGNEFSNAEVGEGGNLIYYGTAAAGGATSNPKPSSTSNTDLFLIHENSGFWKG